MANIEKDNSENILNRISLDSLAKLVWIEVSLAPKPICSNSN